VKNLHLWITLLQHRPIAEMSIAAKLLSPYFIFAVTAPLPDVINYVYAFIFAVLLPVSVKDKVS